MSHIIHNVGNSIMHCSSAQRGCSSCDACSMLSAYVLRLCTAMKNTGLHVLSILKIQKACCLQLGHAKVLSGVRSWQRNAVAGAALQCFCSWMVTFSDEVITRFARLALSLAAAGCPWLQAEAQHVLQVCRHLTHFCIGHAKRHMTSMSMSMLDHSARLFNRPVTLPSHSTHNHLGIALHRTPPHAV